GGVVRRARGGRGDADGARGHPRDDDLARAAAAVGDGGHRARHGGDRGPVRAARLLPVPSPALGGGAEEDPGARGADVRGRLPGGRGEALAAGLRRTLLPAAVQAHHAAAGPEGGVGLPLPARRPADARRGRPRVAAPRPVLKKTVLKMTVIFRTWSKNDGQF